MAEPTVHLWYAALAAEYGIILKTTDQDKLVQRLYTLRRESKIPDFDNLSVIRPPGKDDEVWIAHKVIGGIRET